MYFHLPVATYAGIRLPESNMNLINLGKCVAKDDGNCKEAAYVEDFQAVRAIEQLRNRIVSPEYCDSLEVKTAIIGEMVFQCFKELQKRRYL
jgi:hypothetical protein